MKPRGLDLWVSLGLAMAALVIRLPFRSQFLYHWDSVNFALSLENYDVRLHQPHPPGYFLYSMLGKLVNLFMHDANASLIWISLLSGVLGVVGLYWLGMLMFNRQVSIVAALLALTNPLHWFYSELGLSYALEFLLVTIVAGLCYLQLTGRRQVWLLSAILLGLIGGVRQNDLVFLFPLWLVSLYALSWRQRAISVMVLGLVVGAWVWPMMVLSGGPAAYMAALTGESSGIANESSLSSLRQFSLNGVRMLIYLGYGLLLGVIPLMWGIWLLGRKIGVYLLDRRVWVLALWIGPAACFYLLVHLRQHGHIFTFLPALILLTALAVIQLGRNWGGVNRAHALIGGVALLLIVTNGLFFLLSPVSLFGSNRLPLQTPSRQTIVERDDFLRKRIDYIKTHFKPESTVVLADGFDFRHPSYYLRDYQLSQLSFTLPEEGQQLPETVKTLVLFIPGTEQDFQISGAQPGPQLEGDLLPYFVRTGENPIYVSRSVETEMN